MGAMISLHEGKGPAARKAAERVITLRLQVLGCEPRIWRRLVVRETMWLSRLHDAIQICFEWFDYQTHVFTFDDVRFGNPLRRDGVVVEDDRDVTLADIDLGSREKFQYTYHFGESWQVEVRIEKTGPLVKRTAYPTCTGGENAGPPEDCGGVEAFHDMVASLQESDTDIGREWRDWVGPDYDPAVCNLEKINRSLRKLGK